MTESELLQSIAARPWIDRIGTPEPAIKENSADAERRAAEGVQFKIVGAYEVRGSDINRFNIGYYVLDPGTVDELAYFQHQTPESYRFFPPEPDTRIDDAIGAMVGQAFGAGTVIAGRAVELHNDKAFAIVEFFVDTAGTVTRKRAVARRAENGAVTFRAFSGE